VDKGKCQQLLAGKKSSKKKNPFSSFKVSELIGVVALLTEPHGKEKEHAHLEFGKKREKEGKNQEVNAQSPLERLWHPKNCRDLKHGTLTKAL